MSRAAWAPEGEVSIATRQPGNDCRIARNAGIVSSRPLIVSKRTQSTRRTSLQGAIATFLPVGGENRDPSGCDSPLMQSNG